MSIVTPAAPVPRVFARRPFRRGGEWVGHRRGDPSRRHGALAPAVPGRYRRGRRHAFPWLLCWLLLAGALALGGAPEVARAAGPLAGRTVVLDPEEGGSNPGSVGGGIDEKTVNLATALDVGTLLRQDGARVVYTRSTDVAVSLPTRAALANQVRADAFVTLAANGLNDPAVSGVVTFYGGATGYVGGRTRGAVLVGRGRALAQAVQMGVVRTTGAVDRGIQPAAFYVLGYTRMPAILIETGFLTNPAEAQRLATPAYRWAIAQGIVAGLGQFFGGAPGAAAVHHTSGAADPASSRLSG